MRGFRQIAGYGPAGLCVGVAASTPSISQIICFQNIKIKEGTQEYNTVM
jgi:hypothetical protein